MSRHAKSGRPGIIQFKHEPDTKDGIVERIGFHLDAVQKLMDGPRQHTVSWMYATYSASIVSGARETIRTLTSRLSVILSAESDDHTSDVWDFVRQAFSVPLGSPMQWTKAGDFLLWLDDIPVRCLWEGFAFPGLSLHALDAESLWLTGYECWAAQPHEIPSAVSSVEELARGILQRQTQPRAYSGPKVQLWQLRSEEADKVRSFLDDPANAWWRAQLARGPVNPIPLPEDMAPVQQRLFA